MGMNVISPWEELDPAVAQVLGSSKHRCRKAQGLNISHASGCVLSGGLSTTSGLLVGRSKELGSKCGKAVTSLPTGSEITHHTHLLLGLAHVLRPVPKLTEITGTLSTDTNELQIWPIKSCSKTAAIWDYF